MSSEPPSDRDRQESTARVVARTLGERRRSLDALVAEFYGDLRRIARRRMRSERPGHTLSTTALVHESYLKLDRLDRMQWQSQAQFFAEAARAMRRVLVDHAVRRGAEKRGGGRVRVELDENLAVCEAEEGALLALHEALERLARERPRHARVVECRLFAGMTVTDIAEALGISTATVKRDWQLARAWLNRELADGTA